METARDSAIEIALVDLSLIQLVGHEGEQRQDRARQISASSKPRLLVFLLSIIVWPIVKVLNPLSQPWLTFSVLSTIAYVYLLAADFLLPLPINYMLIIITYGGIMWSDYEATYRLGQTQQLQDYLLSQGWQLLIEKYGTLNKRYHILLNFILYWYFGFFVFRSDVTFWSIVSVICSTMLITPCLVGYRLWHMYRIALREVKTECFNLESLGDYTTSGIFKTMKLLHQETQWWYNLRKILLPLEVALSLLFVFVTSAFFYAGIDQASAITLFLFNDGACGAWQDWYDTTDYELCVTSRVQVNRPFMVLYITMESLLFVMRLHTNLTVTSLIKHHERRSQALHQKITALTQAPHLFFIAPPNQCAQIHVNHLLHEHGLEAYAALATELLSLAKRDSEFSPHEGMDCQSGIIVQAQRILKIYSLLDQEYQQFFTVMRHKFLGFFQMNQACLVWLGISWGTILIVMIITNVPAIIRIVHF